MAASGFLARIGIGRLFDRGGGAEEGAPPLRARRTIDAATVLAAEHAHAVAVPPVQVAPTIAPPPEPSFPAIESQDPIAWLANQPAKVRDYVAAHWHWETDLTVLKWLVEQPDCDAGTAADVFWTSGAAEDFIPFGTCEPEAEEDLLVAEIEDVIGRRFTAGDFVRADYAMDSSWPFDRWLERLRYYRDEGRIDWDPDAIPTASPSGRSAVADLSDAERAAADGFLESLQRL